MPARRKTLTELSLSGQLSHNPSRYKDRFNQPKSSGPLGKPPAKMRREDRVAWRELVKLVPGGVLERSDRWLVEVCAGLMAGLRKHGALAVPVGHMALLMKGLSLMGLSPVDRLRVSVPPDPNKPNAFADLDRDWK
jgi:hypothetical protein